MNLDGDYDYLTKGYYASQDLELEGKPVHPTTLEAIDAYTAPIALEKAHLAGLKVPSYYVTNDYFEPPVIVDTINPFMSRDAVVLRPGGQDRAAKSMTRNYTYAICCQELPAGARVGRFRAVLGWSPIPRYRELAEKTWEVFHLPLATVRTVVLASGEALFSGLWPLPYEKLTPRELAYVFKTLQLEE